MSNGIVRRIDDLGRIVVPKEIRKMFFGTASTEGVPMEISIDKDAIVLKKHEEVKTDSKVQTAIEDLEELKRCYKDDASVSVNGLSFEQSVQNIIDGLKNI